MSSNIYPRRFDDDGTDVTLDVHGLSVDEALGLVDRTLQEAHRRGRARVVVIHGSSSADVGGRRTIKTELERQLADGAYATWVSGPRWSGDGGQCTLWLQLGPPRNLSKIRADDVVR